LQVTIAVGYEAQQLSFPESSVPEGFGWLQDLALKCMARDPAERPTAEAVCVELERRSAIGSVVQSFPP